MDSSVRSKRIEELRFDNAVLRALPVDPEERNFVRQVKNACFSRVSPQPVENPMLVAGSAPALALIDLPPSEGRRSDFAEFFSGSRLIPGSEPAAHCYCGHQFGSFSGQLGDGAAMYLGEVVNEQGERWELQLKGAGPTPYSRSADGRKVLRSSIREFLCSEAMFYLGVATTRSGSVVTSDSTVIRDPLYNGNVIHERCTIISRLAPTFLRFGSFEIFKERDPKTQRAGPSVGNNELRVRMLEFAIESYYPGIAHQHPARSVERYAEFYREVVRRTALLVASWQTIGWVHGVLNTDNMSIMGLTIDYGPFGFMEHFDQDFVPNGSDGGWRYSYRNQPTICRWNLEKFAEALHPALPLDVSRQILAEYDETYNEAYMTSMRGKLGLTTALPEDVHLVQHLFDTMQATMADFTDTFRILMQFVEENSEREHVPERIINLLLARCASPSTARAAYIRKRSITKLQMPPQQVMMLSQLIEQSPDQLPQLFGPTAPIDAIIEEVKEEKAKLDSLQAVINKIEEFEKMQPAEKRANDADRWRAWLAMYASRLARDRESGANAADRLELMGKHNPTFILRNWVAQDAIEAAEQLDFSKVQGLLQLLFRPYDPTLSSLYDQELMAQTEAHPKPEQTSELSDEDGCPLQLARHYARLPPEWAAGLICTCSS